MNQEQEFLKFWNCLPSSAQDDAWLISLVHHGKKPAIPKDESWQDDKYRLTPEAAKRRLERGGNVGISFRGKAGVADIDCPEKAKDYFCAGMLETLIVRTRDGNLHVYYLNDGTIENHDQNIDGTHILEFRTKWRYLVAPGSFVPPTNGSGGDGFYRVVNPLSAKMVGRGDLPWLKQLETTTVYTPVDFKGKFLNLPCVHLFFELLLRDGRATRASKLLATAAVMDGADDDKLKNIDGQFTDFQNTGSDKKLPRGGTVRWGKNIREKKRAWNCGEMINYLRGLRIFPPCSGCPLKMREAKRDGV